MTFLVPIKRVADILETYLKASRVWLKSDLFTLYSWLETEALSHQSETLERRKTFQREWVFPVDPLEWNLTQERHVSKHQNLFLVSDLYGLKTDQMGHQLVGETFELDFLQRWGQTPDNSSFRDSTKFKRTKIWKCLNFVFWEIYKISLKTKMSQWKG